MGSGWPALLMSLQWSDFSETSTINFGRSRTLWITRLSLAHSERPDYSVLMTLREELIAEINEFLSRTGMHATAFGLQCRGDGSFVQRLRDGVTDPRASTIDAVRKWMAEADALYRKPKRSRPKRAARHESVAA